MIGSQGIGLDDMKRNELIYLGLAKKMDYDMVDGGIYIDMC